MRQAESAKEDLLLEEQAEGSAELILNEPDLLPVMSPAAELAEQASLHHLPRGAGPGTFLHNLLQDAAEEGFAAVANNPQLRAQLLAKRCRHGNWLVLKPLLDNWLASYLKTPFALPDGGNITLAQLQQYKAEPEFWFAVNQVSAKQLDDLVSQQILPNFARPRLQPNYLNGMLKGFIDLVFEHQGRYYVVDYKSNYLGPDDQAYSPQAMREKILASRYDMQYVLYTLALHKLLKARLNQAYCYDSHVGGVLYLFLRGQHASTAGVFSDKPPRSLIEQLEQYLNQAPQADPLALSKELADA